MNNDKQARVKMLASAIHAVQWFLTFVFIGLKITNLISWDWVWVIMPLWIFEVINLVMEILRSLYNLSQN